MGGDMEDSLACCWRREAQLQGEVMASSSVMTRVQQQPPFSEEEDIDDDFSTLVMASFLPLAELDLESGIDSPSYVLKFSPLIED